MMTASLLVVIVSPLLGAGPADPGPAQIVTMACPLALHGSWKSVWARGGVVVERWGVGWPRYKIEMRIAGDGRLWIRTGPDLVAARYRFMPHDSGSGAVDVTIDGFTYEGLYRLDDDRLSISLRARGRAADFEPEPDKMVYTFERGEPTAGGRSEKVKP